MSVRGAVARSPAALQFPVSLWRTFIVPGLRTSLTSRSPAGCLVGAQTWLSDEPTKPIPFMGPPPEPGLGRASSYIVALIILKSKSRANPAAVVFISFGKVDVRRPSVIHVFLPPLQPSTFLCCSQRLGPRGCCISGDPEGPGHLGCLRFLAFLPSRPGLPLPPEGVHPLSCCSGLLQDPPCAPLRAPSRNALSLSP